MTQRLVLVEGPDDLAALRELAERLFHVTKAEQPPKPGASRKTIFQTSAGVRIEISVGLNAKDGLPKAVATAIRGLPPQMPGDEARTDKIAVLYDPDDDAPGAFEARVDKELNASLPLWAIQRSNFSCWNLRRGQEEPVELSLIAWKANGPVLDGLPDQQNLERLISQIMVLAYPNERTRIEGWLSDIQELRRRLTSSKAPKWKAAVLLWAALVDDQVTADAGMASRFFGQHTHGLGGDFFKDYVEPCIQASGLGKALEWVFT